MERPGVLDNLRITVLADDCVLYESPYLGQHGASFLHEGMTGRNTKRILIDVGQNFEALLHNMRTSGISPSGIYANYLNARYTPPWKFSSLIISSTASFPEVTGSIRCDWCSLFR